MSGNNVGKIRAVIDSVGHFLPDHVLDNETLAKKVDTSDEWITQRTGIRQRHIAGKDETTSDMALKAAQHALSESHMRASDIDAVIVATTTPDRTFPAVATTIQHKLGTSPSGFAFDVQAVCSGFVYAMSVANSMIISGQAKSILVIGAEKMSSLLDWNDRTTCVLFGDGAGAVILRAEEGEYGDHRDRGIFSTHLHANGAHNELLYVDGGPSSTGDVGHLRMEGKEVFRHAVQCLSEVVEETLQANDLAADAIDYLVPHQANIRIIESTAKKLSMPMDKVVVTLDRHGNTSAASIPLALSEAVHDGRIEKGHMLLLEAMGGGFTWGSVLVRF
jgi:3-oxoacyl-[acyl-carrier-protein] synthase-3